jgi:MFS family permease
LIIAGIILLYVFFKFEQKTASPLINVLLFKENRVFAFSSLATLIHYGAASTVGFLISLYLQYVRGFDPAKAGLVLMAQPLIMVIFSSSAGRLSDRVNPGKIASAGMAVTMIGLLALSFLSVHTPLWAVVGCLFLVGGGYALFSSPNSNAVMGSVESRYYGLAAGITSTMRQTGMTVGIAVVTTLLSIFVGKKQISPDLFPKFMIALKYAFLISSALCFVGIFASLVRTREQKRI